MSRLRFPIITYLSYHGVCTVLNQKGGVTLTDRQDVTVYTLKCCPNCERLKDFLHRKGILFMERDMMSADALTELRVNGVFVQEAPVLQIGSEFLTSGELFSDGKLCEDVIISLTGGSAGEDKKEIAG
ncbi:MAG: glutaredoxin family protein [Methanoculleaceae archaeon]